MMAAVRTWRSRLRVQVAAAVFVVGALMVFVVVQQTLRATDAELREQVESSEGALTNLVVEVSRPALLTSEYGDLQEVLMGLARTNGLEHADVHGSDGVIVASLEPERIGSDHGELTSTESLRTEERGVVGSSGLLGSVHLHFSDDVAEAAVAQGRNRALAVGALAVLVTGVVALALGWLASRRLEQLARSLGNVDSDGIPLPVAVRGPLEVEQLADALNTRRAALRSATDERLAASEALEASEDRLQLILEAAADGLFDYHLPTGELSIARRGSALAPRDSEEGRAIADVVGSVHPDDMPRIQAAYTRHLRDGTRLFEVDIRVVTGTGAWRWNLLRARAVDFVDGQPTRLIGVLQDQTQRRELERQVAHADKMRSMGRLVGGLTHDLNNLLAVMKLNVSLLERDDRDRQLDAHRLAQVALAVDDASTLADGLLGLARPASDVSGVLDVDDLVTAMAATLRPLVQDKATLEVAIGAPGGRVQVDRGRAEQILLNLVTNAYDALDGPGVIRISTTLIDLTDRERGALDPGTYVRLTVSDTGTGIPGELDAQIFEPFVTSKPIGAGTGLGLAIVFDTVADAGGAITARNEIGGSGAVVEVLLPVTDAPATTEPKAPTRVERPAGSWEHRAKVMVVDDEPAVLEVVAATLDAGGYHTLEALGPVEAIALAGEVASVDLLLTDVTMPDATGPELADAVRAMHPDVAVLYMTGRRATLDGSAQPVGDVIQKPFDSAELRDRVAEVLERRTTDLDAGGAGELDPDEATDVPTPEPRS